MGLKQILLIVFVLLACIESYAKRKKIFVIESYHVEYPWDKSYKEGLQSELKNKYELRYFQMDTKRLPKDEHSRMAEKAYEQFKKEKPDLLVLADDAALKLVGPKVANQPIPVVFLGINNNPRNYFEKMPSNFTGVLERPLFRRSVSYIKNIFPNCKKILSLWDADITSTVSIADMFGTEATLNVSGIDVTYKSIQSWTDWQKTVLSLNKEYDLVIVGLYHTIKDEAGKQVDAESVVKWTSLNSPIPTFAFWDFAVGVDKVIGGYVLYGKSQGIEAASIILKILEKGVSPDSMPPVFKDEGQFLFSKKQLDKWKIQLPSNIKEQSSFID